MAKTMDELKKYADEQQEYLDKHNIKLLTKVKITRAPDTMEDGIWPLDEWGGLSWDEEMSESYIDKEFHVLAICYDKICVAASIADKHARGVIVPYYVLENAEPKKTVTDYLEGHNSCGLKVGDKVKIIRRAEDYEGGWGNDWGYEMDDFVGNIGEIIGDSDEYGFSIEPDDAELGYWYDFPYFCLEKVEG